MRSLKKVEGINVVPLIDIMLVLLAIVLTVSSFIAVGKLEVTLPHAKSQSKLEPKRYDIAITAQKKFYLNEIEYSKDDLINELNKLTKEDIVAISADKVSLYEDFVFVVDILKLNGIEKISMVIQK